MYTVLCGNGDNNGSVWSFQKVFYYPLYYRIKQEFLSEGFPLVEKAYQLLVLITYKLGYLFDNVRVFLSDYVYKMYVFWSFPVIWSPLALQMTWITSTRFCSILQSAIEYLFHRFEGSAKVQAP